MRPAESIHSTEIAQHDVVHGFDRRQDGIHVFVLLIRIAYYTVSFMSAFF